MVAVVTVVVVAGVLVVILIVVVVDDNCTVQFTIPDIEPVPPDLWASEVIHQHFLRYLVRPVYEELA